jgi:hypothetical protein
MHKYLKYTNIYVVLLFCLPSIIFTFLLYNGYDLPRLSSLSSERFWVYLAENKRSISNGLLSWPGNLDSENFNWIYLERLLVRIIYIPFNTKLYFIVDALMSSFIFIFGLTYIVKKYYSRTDYYLKYLIIIIAIQPIYLLKTLFYGEPVIDLWFGRGLVASASFIIFIIGSHELFFKKNLFHASFYGVLLGLIHFYSFVLFLGTIGLYFIYLTYDDLIKYRGIIFLKKQRWIPIFLNVAIIVAILINTFNFKSTLSLEYFFNRYIPYKINDFDDFLRNASYLLFYLSCCLVASKKFTLSSIEKKLHSLLLTTIGAALLIDIGFLAVAPEAINIHFRIYIIEPLFLLFFVIFMRSRFHGILKIFLLLTLLTGLTLFFNQYFLVTNALNLNDSQYESVHYFMYHDSLANCQCTIFDPDTDDFLDSKIGNLPEHGYIANQWSNSMLHLGRFYNVK